MDNRPSHVTDDIIGLLTEARVRIITFAPYTTQIFQVLDMILFGCSQRASEIRIALGDEKVAAKWIMKVYHNVKQALVEFNREHAFQELRFKFDTETELYRLLFNEKS
jgi:hypothetical protein